MLTRRGALSRRAALSFALDLAFASAARCTALLAFASLGFGWLKAGTLIANRLTHPKVNSIRTLRCIAAYPLLFCAANCTAMLWEYHDNFLRRGQIELTMKWLPRAA
jgi:hypothetical protein